MSDSVLDQLVFHALPLGEPLPKWPPNLSIQLPTSTAQAAQLPIAKVYTQSAPLFARRSPMATSDVNWPAYCGMLRDYGVPLQISFSELQDLSDANAPSRIAKRNYDEGFELTNLNSADLVLIDCVSVQAGQRLSRLPLEIAGWHELKQLVEGMRHAVAAGTPIGLGMLAGDIYTDVSNALAARVDYVVLEFAELAAVSGSSSVPSAPWNYLAWSVVAARNACAQSGMPAFPIFIDAPITNIDHIIKLLALGATAIGIGTLMASAMPAPAPASLAVPKGLLSGIGSLPVKATPNVQPLITKLDELLTRVRSRVFQQQLSSLSALGRDQLRALDQRAARLCAVKLLEHE